MWWVERKKGSGRAAVAEDKKGKVILVVWLGKRGRVCQKSCVYGGIFHKVPHIIFFLFVHTLKKAQPHPLCV